MSYLNKIVSKVKEQKISKIHGGNIIIEIFQNSINIQKRLHCLKALDKILLTNQKVFEFLENLLISDENAKIRIKAADLIIKKFPNLSINSFEWIIENATSPLVLQKVFHLIKREEITSLKKELIKWFYKFGNKLNIDPNETKFILDLEALFEKEENNSYNINNQTYQFYEFLRELKSPRHWFLVKDCHILELKFSFNKWKYLRKYSGQRNELKKYKDLDMMLSLLLNNKISQTESIKIPNTISMLKKLKKLDLSNNNLQNLPQSLGYLDQLEYLNLSYNYFKSLPSCIFNLTHLKILNLSNNEIELIPSSLQSLPHLEVVNIKGNKINSIPNFLQEMSN
ncbi:MAG: hypothetical protein EU541_04750 [Promethearchaeota archaeon]|nr:MAG: hypothetical protein EU541_04750 [Candidatus Lokiarchaeota archaeon]